MKNRFVYAFASFLLGLTSCGEKQATDVDELNLKGDVRKVREFKYTALENFGDVVQGDPFRDEGEWDRDMVFNKAGNFDTVRLITSAGDDVGSVIYEYNGTQKVCEKNLDSEGNLVDRAMFFYKSNRLDRIEKFNADDNISGRKSIEYDDENKMQYTRYYNFKGELLQTLEQKMTKRGYPAVTKIYGREGDLVNWREEKFNSDGMLEKLTVKEPDGNITMVVTFVYDEKGNVVSQTGVDAEGDAFMPHTWKYTYDEHNNWLTSTEFEGGKPTYMTVRTIEYFSK
ncbi:MAG: RHS repeat protein [Paludibacteraceae bacterium]|nr:RHS repeat protein [Paludibacteraceae bacterium]